MVSALDLSFVQLDNMGGEGGGGGTPTYGGLTSH